MTPSEAIILARGIEASHPFFYEDPILPDSFDAMDLVAQNIHIPVATVANGYLVVSDAPGIGIELVDDAQERYPYRPRAVRTRLHADGSVVDQ